jgi:aminopeptidase N
LLSTNRSRRARPRSSRFAGTISETLRGFYRSRYVAADGSKRWLGATQFEATNARRAFPCFDEPATKAPFELTILVPADRSAISNMPVTRQNGRRVTFARTPVMSTLAEIFVGDDHMPQIGEIRQAPAPFDG